LRVRDRRSAADSRWHVRDLAEPPRGDRGDVPVGIDSIAAGCLLAGAREILAKNRVYAAVLRSPFFVLVPLFGFLVATAPRVSFDYAIGQTLENVAIAMTIDGRSVSTRAGRAADRSGARCASDRMVRRLSYSLYLWQQVFVNREGTHWIQGWPYNLLAAFVLALVSYYLVEQPFLRFRERRFKSRPLRPVKRLAEKWRERSSSRSPCLRFSSASPRCAIARLHRPRGRAKGAVLGERARIVLEKIVGDGTTRAWVRRETIARAA